MITKWHSTLILKTKLFSNLYFRIIFDRFAINAVAILTYNIKKIVQ